jgi:hypothetical protein
MEDTDLSYISVYLLYITGPSRPDMLSSHFPVEKCGSGFGGTKNSQNIIAFFTTIRFRLIHIYYCTIPRQVTEDKYRMSFDRMKSLQHYNRSQRQEHRTSNIAHHRTGTKTNIVGVLAYYVLPVCKKTPGHWYD